MRKIRIDLDLIIREASSCQFVPQNNRSVEELSELNLTFIKATQNERRLYATVNTAWWVVLAVRDRPCCTKKCNPS